MGTTASLTKESSHTILRCTVQCQSFVACVTTTYFDTTHLTFLTRFPLLGTQNKYSFSSRHQLTIKMPKATAKATSKAKSTRGDKKKKDPNAPKRGLSAYMFFANEQRENVREENPGISFGQVGKVLGDRWKALSEKQREPYEKKAATDKKRYEDEKAKYNAAASDEDED